MGAGGSSARHPALIEAEVRKLDAETVAVSERTETERERVRAEAETARVRAEAEAETARVRAEAEAASLSSRDMRYAVALFSPLAVGALVTAALAVDWYLHESPARLHRRVAAAYRKGPRTWHSPSPALPVPGDRLSLHFVPTMILGPTGCGKSSDLSKAAAETFKTSPTLLVGLRQPSARLSTNPEARFEDVAQQFYSQINYPGRRALVMHLLKGGVKVKAGAAEASVALPTQDRLVDALKTVFSVGESLYVERTQAGMPPEVAAPALFFDEVQDLIKDERRASVGGRHVFNELAVLLVQYGVDRKVVRTAVAGSSTMLSVEFEKTVAHGARWSHHLVLDPEDAVMMAALERSGYSSVEAADMLQLCGARLRLLNEPLVKGAAVISTSTFCSKMSALAKRHFRDTFSQLPSPSEVACLAAVLDSVERAELGMEEHPTMRALDEYADGSRRSVSLSSVVSKVLYLRLDYTYVFQSKLHRTAWAEARGEYCAPTKKAVAQAQHDCG